MTTQYLSTPRFYKGKIFSLVEKLLHISKNKVESGHAGYKLISHTSAINFRPASMVGIYEDSQQNKFFIKDYAYTLENLDFEYLHNEINTLKVLNDHPLLSSKVRVPRLIQSQDSNKRITLITEYVKGKTINHNSKETIQKELIKVLKYLHDQSFAIPASSLRTIPKRLQIFTYITFPFYLLRALLKDPKESVLFLKASMTFLSYAPKCILQKVPYGIAHRDLSVDNVIYDSVSKQTVMLDTECMVRTDILYDIALLPRLYVRFLNTNQLLSIFDKLNLSSRDKERLSVLMITGCINKIAAEQKGHRDYVNAILGLNLTLSTIIPELKEGL